MNTKTFNPLPGSEKVALIVDVGGITNDVKAMRKYLIDKRGYLRENICVKQILLFYYLDLMK